MTRENSVEDSRPRRRVRLRGLWLSALLAVLAVVITAMSRRPPPPIVEALRHTSPKTPVILVPGITGSILRDRVTQNVIWGTGRRLFVPRDGGFAISLPITWKESQTPRLEASTVIEEIRLAKLLRRSVYGPAITMLEAHGYRRGDLTAPEAAATVFPFAYDWRLSNALSAQLLGQRLEELRLARGEERLRVDLLCHSNGAHICRYLLKYGGASLEDAEAGRAGPPANLEIRKLVLFGSANGGSQRILRELNRGRYYVKLIGRRILPEAAFGFATMYQELPGYRREVFIDSEGRDLDIDLYDAANWHKYNLGFFNRDVRARLRKNPRPEVLGDGEDEQLEFLQRALTDARRFQQVLKRDLPVGDTRYYSIQNVDTDTPDKAVLLQDKGGWRLLFTGDKELKRRPELHALATTRGDRHASLASQKWLAPQEQAALVAAACHAEGDHFGLIFDPASLRCMAHFLAED